MNTIKIIIISGIDMNCSINESLLNSTLVYESNPQNNERVNKSLDILESTPSISQFTTNEFTITLDEKQSTQILQQSDFTIEEFESWVKEL